jgi:hypothetical protein
MIKKVAIAVKRIAIGWKQHWKAQLPGGFLLAFAYMMVIGKVTGTEFALILTAFIPFYTKLIVKTTNKSTTKSQSK